MKMRIIKTTAGIILLSLGVVLLIRVNMGVSAFDTASLAVSMLFDKTYSFGMVLIQLSLFIPVLIYYIRNKLHYIDLVLSILSLLIMPIFVDIFMKTTNDLDIENNLVAFIIAFLIYTRGIAFLVESKLLVAPIDKFLLMLEAKFKHTYAFYKVILDVCFALLAIVIIMIFNYDIPISIYTIFVTIFSGIMIGIYFKIDRFIISKF